MAEFVAADNAMKQLTLASTSINTSPPDPRPTFPVPRELRDAIYKYLLHADYCEVPNVKQRAGNEPPQPSHKFHTNLLCTSKTILEEAAPILYGENSFVAVSHKSPTFFFMLNMMNVPIVSHHGLTAIKHHRLRVHFSWKDPPLLKLWESYPQAIPQFPNAEMKSFVMLANDLPQLCSMLGFECLLAPAQVIHAFCDIDHARFVCVPHKDPHYFSSSPTIHIELRETEHAKMTTAMQRPMLQPFKTVIH